MTLAFLLLALFLFVYSFFFNDTATTEIYTLSLHDALPISPYVRTVTNGFPPLNAIAVASVGRTIPVRLIALRNIMKRSEEHTSELQSLRHLVCRLLLEKKNKKKYKK